MTTRDYRLEGLSCANCAAKIEDEVGALPNVHSASVNFLNESMRVQFATDDMDFENFNQATEAIVKRHEPQIHFQDLSQASASALGLHQGSGESMMDLQGAEGSAVASPHAPSETHHAQHAHQHAHSHSHAHTHSHSHADTNAQEHGHTHGSADEASLKRLRIRIALAVVLFIVGLVAPLNETWRFIVFLAAYLLVGLDVIVHALKNLRYGQVFDEYFLMSLATIGAFVLGQYAEGVAVMLFWQVGEVLQEYAVGHSRRSIADLMDIRPASAWLLRDGDVYEVSPSEVQVGDLIRVRPGERVPLDGILRKGNTSLDTAALTGESMPRDVAPGDEVLSGTINLTGVIEVEVTTSESESTVSKVLNLVENASGRKAKTERFITKFSRYYTPVVTIAAAVLAFVVPLILHEPFHDWIYRSLSFLVISCPCALIASVPIGYFGGIGAVSARGVLVKGSDHLEALNDIKTMVFDKTGTLTQGTFHLKDIVTVPGADAEELLEIAALVESHSNHPIGLSITDAYEGALDQRRLRELEEIPGHGIKAEVDDDIILLGNAKLLAKYEVPMEIAHGIGTIVYMAINGVYQGYFEIADTVKPEASHALEELHEAGVQDLVLLTGDRKEVALDLQKQLALDEVHAELLPQDKVEVYQTIQNRTKGGLTAFVGDGLNDAPVLAGSDLGLAMGGVGSDAAIEAADIVLMTDDLNRIPEAMYVAKETKKIVWENIIFALAVKFLILVLSALGITGMWAAVFADVGVTLLAILNSLRTLRLARGKEM